MGDKETRRIFLPALEENDKQTMDGGGTMVIFLHGWAQNSLVFRNRTKALTKRFLKQGIGCLFLDAPMRLPPLGVHASTRVSTATSATHVEAKGRQDARAWFFYNELDHSDRSLSQSGQSLHYVGLEESLRLLQSELEQIPERTTNICLLGFSQGAVLAHVVAAFKEETQGSSSPWDRIQSCIFVGGFSATPSNCPKKEQQIILSNNISVRSLHVVGSMDTSVPSDQSQSLAKRFRNHKVLEHSKGHLVPQQAAACSTMIDFILGKES